MKQNKELSTKKQCDIHVVGSSADNEIDKCSCGNEYIGEHTCPYQEEINEDSETLCNCCKECTQQCAWDI